MNTRAFHTTITTSLESCSSFIQIITITVQLLRQLLEFTNDTLTNLGPSTISLIGPDNCTPLMPSGKQHNKTTHLRMDHVDENSQSSPQTVKEDPYGLVCHCPSFPILAEPHDIHDPPLMKPYSCPAVVPTPPVRTIHRKQRSYDLRDDYLQTSLSRRGRPCPNSCTDHEKINAHPNDNHTDDPNDTHYIPVNNTVHRPASWPHSPPPPWYKCRLFHSETS